MTIEFVDLENGCVFNGSRPYVHWFNGGQSVGLMHVERLCVLADVKTIRAEFIDGPFALIDPTKFINPQPHNGKEFYELNQCCSSSFISEGVAYDAVNYIHMIYILGNSDIAAEFTGGLRMTDVDNLSEAQEFTIGADFYNINEVLEANLKNFGISIPNAAQKAIYDVSLYEDLPDAITINRKMKELLVEYWDVIANKGSYDSLLNSLAWFEYGPLVTIREHWKKNEPGSNLFDMDELRDILDEKCREYLATKTKSTLIGVYMALNQYLTDDNNQVILQDYAVEWPQDPNALVPEFMPALEDKLFKWDVYDLSLKMTLLGNFFSTFFMPIHLDLVHSTIERIVVAPAMKTLGDNMTSRIDRVENNTPIRMEIECDYQLRPTEFRTYPDTLFKDIEVDMDTPASFGRLVLGIDSHIKETDGTAVQNNIVVDHWANIPACLATFNCVIQDIYDLSFIQQETVTASIWDENEKIWRRVADGTDSVVYESNDEGVIEMSFELAFYMPGLYSVALAFTSNSGRAFVKTVELDIKDSIRQRISLKRVNRLDLTEVGRYFPNELFMPELVFQMENIKIKGDVIAHQYVSAPGRGDNEDSIGLNHTVVFYKTDPLLDNWGLQYTDHSQQITIANIQSLSTLNQNFPNYWWSIMDRYVNEEDINDPDSDPIPKVVIGISKKYTDDMGEGERLEFVAPANLDTLHPQRPRIVDEDRFYPILHQYEDMMEGDRTIKVGTTMACIAEFDRSYLTRIIWTFTNISTGEVFHSSIQQSKYYEDPLQLVDDMEQLMVRNGGTHGTLIIDQLYGKDATTQFACKIKPLALTPGYYNIELNYKMGDTIQTVKMESAFRINKP